MRSEFLLAILVVLVLLFLWDKHAKAQHFAVERASSVVSSVDGNVYRVHLDHPHARDAANLMAALHTRFVSLMRLLRRKYMNMPGAKGDATRRLLARYNPDNLVENSPASPPADTAYTLDKGKLLALCLRSRDGSDRFHSLNLLTFVSLHELAHIADANTAHGDNFWRTFHFLLQEAAVAGLYTPTDYTREPEVYCGLRVDYNPLFDEKINPLGNGDLN